MSEAMRYVCDRCWNGPCELVTKGTPDFCADDGQRIEWDLKEEP